MAESRCRAAVVEGEKSVCYISISRPNETEVLTRRLCRQVDCRLAFILFFFLIVVFLFESSFLVDDRKRVVTRTRVEWKEDRKGGNEGGGRCNKEREKQEKVDARQRTSPSSVPSLHHREAANPGEILDEPSRWPREPIGSGVKGGAYRSIVVERKLAVRGLRAPLAQNDRRFTERGEGKKTFSFSSSLWFFFLPVSAA